MNIKWLHKGRLVVGATVGMLALALVMGSVLAQEPEDGPPLSAAGGSATASFTYQGRLLENGQPVNGTYDFEWTIWDASVAGNAVASSCAGCYAGIAVQDGVFTLYIMLNSGSLHDVFNGGHRWIEVSAAPSGTGNWQVFPRQPIAPAPYAWGLYPGTVISGVPSDWEGWLVKADMTGAYPLASAMWGSAATGHAVRGDSAGGEGVYGYTDDGYAIRGVDQGSTQARGYGGYFYSENGVGVYGYSNGTRVHPNIYSPGVYGRSANGVGVYGRSDIATNSWTSAAVMGWARGSVGGKFLSYNGNLIEGVEDVSGDGYTLETRFKVEYDGDVYADRAYHCGVNDGGNATTIDENTGCMYDNSPADFAEVLPAADDPEPGDVLIVGRDGQLTASTAAYQSSVVGVYSTRPSYVGNSRYLGQDGYVPLAVVGLVPVKASAENGAILPGDLLVSSATPGHAMKAGADSPQGTVIGKALEGLDATQETGVIQMLVTLQ